LRGHLRLVTRAPTSATTARRDTLTSVIEDQIRLSALMSRVARGDEAAFAEIYDALAGKVFGLARRVVRDPAQAQEVAQEVMLEVWRKAPRYSSSLGTVSVWILTITHRRAVDRVRSAQAASDRDQAASNTRGFLPPLAGKQGRGESTPKVQPWEPNKVGAFLDHVAATPLSALFEVAALTGYAGASSADCGGSMST
jgi:DNA-directed RNA polymerase specialized sigma24 family protein